MKVRDMQRRIDAIRQGKVPYMTANNFRGMLEIYRLQLAIDALHGKTVGINVVTYESRVQAGSSYAVGGRASLNDAGGVWRGKGYATGGAYGQIGSWNERGAELAKFPNGTMIYPAGQARGMWDNATRGSNKVTLEINSGGSKLDDLLVELLRKAVRTRGGDVQLVLGR